MDGWTDERTDRRMDWPEGDIAFFSLTSLLEPGETFSIHWGQGALKKRKLLNSFVKKAGKGRTEGVTATEQYSVA